MNNGEPPPPPTNIAPGSTGERGLGDVIYDWTHRPIAPEWNRADALEDLRAKRRAKRRYRGRHRREGHYDVDAEGVTWCSAPRQHVGTAAWVTNEQIERACAPFDEPREPPLHPAPKGHVYGQGPAPKTAPPPKPRQWWHANPYCPGHEREQSPYLYLPGPCPSVIGYWARA